MFWMPTKGFLLDIIMIVLTFLFVMLFLPILSIK